HGARLNEKYNEGKTALMKAVESFNKTNISSIKFLIDRGADVNAVNNKGETALILAAKRGKADFKKDGFITVKGLALHTEERVMTLSEEVFKRQQNPMIETGANDFPIGRVK
ncbi:MAG TPA: ankyrin repeat domain-containing protein, partial [Desulfuromonadaceae bacterium]